jgi:hypothetical protein
VADTKTSALAAIPVLDGADVLPIVDATDTVTKKVSITQLDGRYATAAQGTTADGAVAKSLVDAKGDLIVATADNTVARLPVGATNGHVLTVDSVEATGVKWAAAVGGGSNQFDNNYIDNYWSTLGPSEMASPGTHGNAIAMVSGRLIAVKKIVRDECSIDGFKFFLNTVGGSGARIQAGLYAAVNGKPSGAPLVVTGEIDIETTGTGYKKPTFTPVSMTPGIYFEVYWTNDTTARVSMNPMNGGGDVLAMGNNADTLSPTFSLVFSSTYAATMPTITPSDFDVSSASPNYPLTSWWRVQI